MSREPDRVRRQPMSPAAGGAPLVIRSNRLLVASTSAGPSGTAGTAGTAGSAGTLVPGHVVVDRASGVIVETVAGRPEPRSGGVAGLGAVQLVDLGDRIVAPGFVDVHVHGGDGAQVNGDDPDEVHESLARLARFHAAHGTTSLVATTVSDSRRRLAATLAGVADAAEASAGGGGHWKGARILGAHLEGPFLSPRRAGAQNPAELRSPDVRELAALAEAARGRLRMVTVAPELPGAMELVGFAVEAGLVVAIGHSEAGEDVARAAFSAGASHVTHLFNAMAPMHHRRPGLVGAALGTAGVTLEVIADGQHVHPSVLALVWRLAGERVVAVTDATPAAGLPAGRHRLGTMEVEVEPGGGDPGGDEAGGRSGRAGGVGRVSLAGDPCTLAGSLLTMDRAVSLLAGPVGLGLADALKAASATPGTVAARWSGAPAGDRLVGTLAEGASADLVCLDDNLNVAATLVGGVPVHDPGRLFA